MPKQRREWKLYNEDVERTFTQHQTQITQLSDSITLQASTITSLDGKVENYYSTLTVADTGIRTEVANKVGKDTVISTINQSAESVTINASKVNMSAYVTFIDLSNSGSTSINGANIQTGSISATKIDVADLQALGATIGGFTIDTSSIRSGTTGSTSSGAVALSTVDFSRTINSSSRSALRFAIGGNFAVNSSGTVYASNLNAYGGSIGGWTIGSSGLYGGTIGSASGVGMFSSNYSATIGGKAWSDWRIVAGSNFGVDSLGNLVANGTLYAGNLITNNTVQRTGAYADLSKFDHIVTFNIPTSTITQINMDLSADSGQTMTIESKYTPTREIWAPITWAPGNNAWKLGTARIEANGTVTFYCYDSYGGGLTTITASNYSTYGSYKICLSAAWFTS